mmetsp:Transcript_47342/g.110508  ORF Transcript_47342/g.110508 Transcript_47342/m.110508 type:complete len:210 (+) Transcript_47342:47-676(+)
MIIIRILVILRQQQTNTISNINEINNNNRLAARLSYRDIPESRADRHFADWLAEGLATLCSRAQWHAPRLARTARFRHRFRQPVRQNGRALARSAPVRGCAVAVRGGGGGREWPSGLESTSGPPRERYTHPFSRPQAPLHPPKALPPPLSLRTARPFRLWRDVGHVGRDGRERTARRHERDAHFFGHGGGPRREHCGFGGKEQREGLSQ